MEEIAASPQMTGLVEVLLRTGVVGVFRDGRFVSVTENSQVIAILHKTRNHGNTMASNRLDQIASYFNEKERRRLEEIARNSAGGLPEMTEDEVRLSCLQNDGYDSPELNDKLYLHFKGYKKIENLDKYTGCKAIWLDSNGLQRIEGLNMLVNLRCLYLAKNLITKIEGLDTLVHLTSIDLSNNRITCVENLSQCTSLQTLNLSRNALTDTASLQHLTHCHSIDNLDLTHNAIDGTDIIDAIFCNMSGLVTLSVNGNPLAQTPSFRKLTIVAIPKLGYLDRPVDEVERLGAQAFVRGGVEAERLAREAWKEQQRQSRRNEMEAFRTWQRDQLSDLFVSLLSVCLSVYIYVCLYVCLCVCVLCVYCPACYINATILTYIFIYICSVNKYHTYINIYIDMYT